MNPATLKQLRYFDALARHCHFGRAAETCAISQPALSMQIKELEETLGGVLIERGARQVGLTNFGEEVAMRVRDILRAVDELDERSTLSDETWAALGEELSDRQRMDLVFTVGAYAMLAMAFNTFGVQLEQEKGK